MKYLLVAVLFLVIIGGVLLINMQINNGGNKMSDDEKVFQGPVRPTDNEEHFRKTGETIPLNKL